MEVTFHNVTITIGDVTSADTAYDELCERLSSGGGAVEFTTDTYSESPPEISILLEAAEELEVVVRERYGVPPHPAYEHKVARDMELPRQLRELVTHLSTRDPALHRTEELFPRTCVGLGVSDV